MMTETLTTTPLAYLITFTCYGTRLHGDPSLTVSTLKNIYNTPKIKHSEQLLRLKHTRMKQPLYTMDKNRRKAVLEAIIEVCKYRKWRLLAAHIRSSHVHIIVNGYNTPEKMMNDFKAYASRKLNNMGFENKDRKRCTRHGSTVYIWDDQGVADVMKYVVYGQGDPMEVYANE